MAKFEIPRLQKGGGGGGGGATTAPPDVPPSGPPRYPSAGWPRGFPRGKFRLNWVTALIALAVIYGGYVWFIKRVVVGPDEVLVLLKKDGDRTLPGDQIVIPAAPDKAKDPEGYRAWEETYVDVNGILEQPYLTGTYFVSPWDYERTVEKVVEVGPGEVGIVVRLFGDPLPEGRLLADPDKAERGPLPGILQPGRYPEYSNPHAYTVQKVAPVVVGPGERGVVTVMAGRPPEDPNQYLVAEGERGVQTETEPEGLRYVNPYEQRITPVSVKSQRFEMTGQDAITFPSKDSFEIKVEGFVEWSVDPDRLPQIYVQYAEANDLLPFLEEKVILPYSRSYSRLVGSNYTASELIDGKAIEQFRREFLTRLREACRAEGILIRQALISAPTPPPVIQGLIQEREVARQRINTLKEQIKVAQSQAELARQEALAIQKREIGDANRQVVTLLSQAEQTSETAITQANQELAVAKLQRDAAVKQAAAEVARGEADASVIVMQHKAEAEPLQRQVAAFGDGTSYARYFYYQKLAPSIKSILTTTDGPFANLFEQYNTPEFQAPPVTFDGTGTTDATEATGDATGDAATDAAGGTAGDGSTGATTGGATGDATGSSDGATGATETSGPAADAGQQNTTGVR